MRLVAPLLGLVLLSCDAFTKPLCACTPAQAGSVLLGTISSATGVPTPGLRVRAEYAFLPCDTFYSNPTSSLSASDGKYSITVASGWADSVCVRLFARDTTPGAPEVALAESPRLLLRWWPFDSTALDLALPP